MYSRYSVASSIPSPPGCPRTFGGRLAEFLVFTCSSTALMRLRRLSSRWEPC
jgi:hypothetical protein